MGNQIIFFKKNKADYSNDVVTATASQGNDYASLVLNRSNKSGWITTGSVDSDNPTLTIDMIDEHTITDVLLLVHNFKNFTVKYWNGSSYADFSPAINVTNNTAESNHYAVTSVSTSKIQVTITGTQTPNEDKFLAQLIVTERIGQLNAWPIIKNPIFDKNKASTKMLSGKTFIQENVGAFSVELTVKSLNDSTDLTTVETLYDSSEGFLVWLCGGSETQFSSVRQGYRMEDLFLMKCANNYSPEWYNGLYKTGIPINIKLVESVT